MAQKILVFSLLILIAACAKEQPKPPQVQKMEKAPPNVPSFNEDSAFSYLTAQTDFGPRNPGSSGHQKCLEYLQREMQKNTDAVNLQPFTIKGYEGQTFNLTNIIASFNLQATTRILLLAHWDTRPRADQEKDSKKRNQPILGANDGASGVAILMEMSRQIKASPPAAGVDILFVDGEDYGKEADTKNYFLGARYFAQHQPPGYAPAFGILLDMVGDKELDIEREENSVKAAPDIVNLVWSTARDLGIPQFSTQLQYALDDHIPLNEAGIKTIDLIDFHYPDASNKYWHTTEDTPDKCSAESLGAVGRVLLHVIYNYSP